ncbi:MAG TPA: hypothetical protein VND68_02325 [Chloroflexia bacterium]|jgi:hypothetical protein|nr:hypothetical protein [Chloroflexia bacterium]
MDNPEALVYFWTRTLLVCGLLGAGGITLALERPHMQRFASHLLVGMAVFSALAAGIPLWIPNPHLDYMVPVVPFFLASVVVGVLVGLLCRRVWKGHGLPVALVISGAAALLYALLTDLDVLVFEGRGGSGRGLYVLPAAIAGVLLAWLVTSHQAGRAFYVVGWVVVTATWLLVHYTGEVGTLEDALWYTTYQTSDLTSQAARLAHVGQSQLVASVAYLTGSLLLLALPFILKRDRPRPRPQDVESPVKAVMARS